MKYAMNVLVVSAIVGLVGCVSTEKKINTVSLGMNKQQVIETMGNPDNSRAAEGVEYLIYKLKAATDAGACAAGWGLAVFTLGVSTLECAREKADYFVQLEAGKVTAYGQVGDFDSTKVPEATINVNETVKEAE